MKRKRKNEGKTIGGKTTYRSECKKRCWGTKDEKMRHYHDCEWGSAKYHFLGGAKCIFESMVLQIFQCGLTWKCVFNKRDGFRKAFGNFSIDRVAKFDEKKVEQLAKNSKIIRNRAKIKAAIENAKLILKMGKKKFLHFLWDFVPSEENERYLVDASPSGNHMRTDFKDKNYAKRTRSDGCHPTKTCVLLSKALKREGFKFMGPTVTLSFMQAVGMMNHHTRDCFVFKRLECEFEKLKF
jgi:DNA-3-methyladenine glycosylase I